MRTAMLAGGALLLALVAALLLVGAGEVATLSVSDARGHHLETELWIVDLDGSSWVRAAGPHEDWLERLRERPDALLIRGGASVLVRAVPVEDAGARSAVEADMARKYGLGERLLERLRFGRPQIPVRLEPITASH